MLRTRLLALLSLRRVQANRGVLWLLAWLMISASADIDPQKMQAAMMARYGADGIALLNAWDRMMASAANLPAEAQVNTVNAFFNRHISYADDIALWHKSDYWATPLETLGRRAGDCEDFAIAKYLSLVNLGIPPSRLRLIYVRAQIGGQLSRVFQAHMVLGYYPRPTATPLILDSLMVGIEPADRRTDLRPVFSFNSEGLWIGNQQTNQDPTTRLSRWRNLLARVQAEGLRLPSPAQTAAPLPDPTIMVTQKITTQNTVNGSSTPSSASSASSASELPVEAEAGASASLRSRADGQPAPAGASAPSSAYSINASERGQ